MRIVVLSAPLAEPVTLAEARSWLNMTDDNDTDQDAEILLLVAAMRKYAENYTGRAFVDRELELVLDCWPACRVIELPIAPLLAVNYIRYKDTDGVLQSLYDVEGSPTIGAAGVVEISTKSAPGRLQPAYGTQWPIIRAGDFDPIQIGFAAGYATGGSPADLSVIPPELKLWTKQRLATLYENRETIIIGTIVTPLPRALADAILDPLVLARRVVS